VDEGAADEVGRVDVGHVPEAFATVLHDLHVVGAAGIVFYGNET
jgi:hypothetical protein